MYYFEQFVIDNPRVICKLMNTTRNYVNKIKFLRRAPVTDMAPLSSICDGYPVIPGKSVNK